MQMLVCRQVVDTLGVVGDRSLPSRSRRWRPSNETRRGSSTYGSKKKPEMRKPGDQAASWTNSNSTPPTNSSHGMPLGVRLSGHTRFYNNDSLPKGLSWMRGYRIEPRRQRCSDDRADSSVTSVQGHCLRSRGLPHNAKSASVRPKKPMCSCSGGVVYHLVCEFRSRRRSRNNADDEESKKVVDDVGMPVTQHEWGNSVHVTSESDSDEGVDDDEGTTAGHEQDQKEDSPRDDADYNERNSVDRRNNKRNSIESRNNQTNSVDSGNNERNSVDSRNNQTNSVDSRNIETNSVDSRNNETNSVDSRNNENPMEGTYTIETTHVTKSSAVQEVSTVTEMKSDGHQHASGESSDAESINEDINVGDSDNDARNTIEFVKSNK